MDVTFRRNKGNKAWAKGLRGIKSPKARSGKGLRILKPGKCRPGKGLRDISKPKCRIDKGLKGINIPIPKPGKGLRDIYHGEIQWAWAIQQMLFCVWQWW